MHIAILNNKMQKTRENIEAYMNIGNSQTQKRSEQYPPQIARVNSQASNISNSLYSNQAPKPIVKTQSKHQFQLQSVTYNMKKYDTGEMSMKYSKDEGILSVFFSDDLSAKVRVDVRRDDLKGTRIQCDPKKGSISFGPKILTFKRLDIKDNTKNGNQWIRDKIQKEARFLVIPKDKEQIKLFKESSFSEGLIDGQSNSVYVENARVTEPIPQEINEAEEDHANPKYTMPTAEKLTETQKLRKTIKDMKQQDKITILMDILKIKKEYEDPTGINKKLKCPIYTCQKTYREIQQLKTHLKTKHPQLGKHGIQLTEYDGSFEYSNKALDLAIYLGKIYPHETKKLIKVMKTKVPE